jgi:MFS family permease
VSDEPLGAAFRRLWVAAATSSLGDGVTLAALPLLAASLTRDPLAVSAVTLCQQLPWLGLALVSGALVDRLDRRRVMGRVDLARAAIMGVLALSVAADVPSIGLLCGLAFLLGTAQTLFDTAAQSILPAAVPSGRLEAANSRLYGAQIVAGEFAGPPLGSLLFAGAAAIPFAVDGMTFAVAAILVLGMRGSFAPRERVRGPLRGLGGEIAEGLRWLWGHHLLRGLAILLGIQVLVFSAVISVFVLFCLEVLGVSRAAYGVLFASTAIGSVIGALVAPRLAGRLGAGPCIFGAVLLQGAVGAAIGLSSDAWVVGVLIAAFGFCAYTWNVLTVSLRQAIVPNHLLGRVNGAYRLAGWGTAPIGALLGGALASTAGLRAPFVVGGVIQAAAALAAVPLLLGGAIARARAAARG